MMEQLHQHKQHKLKQTNKPFIKLEVKEDEVNGEEVKDKVKEEAVKEEEVKEEAVKEEEVKDKVENNIGSFIL
jgi:hypothetical protein